MANFGNKIPRDNFEFCITQILCLAICTQRTPIEGTQPKWLYRLYEHGV